MKGPEIKNKQTLHLLEVRNLSIRFDVDDGIVHAVNNVSYTLDDGETLGVVGESGCGKSVHALSIMRLLPIPPGRVENGEIFLEGVDLLKLSKEEMRRVRGAQIAMIFQDPMTSLNPVLKIGYQLTEMMKLHLGMNEQAAQKRAIELLSMVGIPAAKSRMDDYPHNFSGGMRQRAMIAMALSCKPKVLIADEPTTALDVTIQSQLVDLVKELQKELDMAVIWITHDLGVVAGLTQRVNVMYAGYIVETGSVRDIYKNPHHPYTLGLLNSLPRLDKSPGKRLFSIKGEPPELTNLASGCPFIERCNYVIDRCRRKMPQAIRIETGHFVACWEWEKVEIKK